MAQDTVAHPKVVSRAVWLDARKQLLEEEKALTRQMDRANAARRQLPMVQLDKSYVFDGPNGKTRLLDLFEGRHQLIVYHFMFDPEWEKGCRGCTGFVNSLGNLSLLGERDTSFALISRAPLAKLETYKAEQGWHWPWVSSYGSDFNYDFHVTLDPAIAPPQYDYRSQAELASRSGEEPHFTKGECHGLSVFFHLDGEIFHTYSTYARGCESLTDAYQLLDVTPYGRQEDFEDSPPGWPQRPTYG